MLSFYCNQNLCDSIIEATWTWQSYPLRIFYWFRRNKDDITIVAQHVRDLCATAAERPSQRRDWNASAIWNPEFSNKNLETLPSLKDILTWEIQNNLLSDTIALLRKCARAMVSVLLCHFLLNTFIESWKGRQLSLTIKYFLWVSGHGHGRGRIAINAQNKTEIFVHCSRFYLIHPFNSRGKLKSESLSHMFLFDSDSIAVDSKCCPFPRNTFYAMSMINNETKKRTVYFRFQYRYNIPCNCPCCWSKKKIAWYIVWSTSQLHVASFLLIWFNFNPSMEK